MKTVTSTALFVLLSLLTGCRTTKTVTIVSKDKMNVGQLMTCIYANDTLYCGKFILKPEDLKQSHIMDGVVFAVRAFDKNQSEIEMYGESGTYPSNFSSRPHNYSLWTCHKTVTSDTPVNCTLLIEPDSHKVHESVELARFEDDTLHPLTEERIISDCGNPRSTTIDSKYKTMLYSTTHSGVLAQIRFTNVDNVIDRAFNKKAQLDEIEFVDATTNLYINGSVWEPTFFDTEQEVRSIREYLPCLR
jgi:hypothetical protein